MQSAQMYLFLFLLAMRARHLIGGPVGDRIGRKRVIWFSILGVAPFTLLLPHVGLPSTALLSLLIGLILSSAFSAILVFAQELMPGKVGAVSGLFFGFAFGMGGIGAAVLGGLADRTASSSCTGSAHSCRCSASWRRSCPTSSSARRAEPRDEPRISCSAHRRNTGCSMLVLSTSSSTRSVCRFRPCRR